MRDLLVFVILFFLGLAVWTTGLFPAVPAQPAAPIQAQPEQAAQVEQAQALSESPAVQAMSLADLEPDPGSPSGGTAFTANEREPKNDHRPVLEQFADVAEDTRSSPGLEEHSKKAITRVVIPSLKVDARVIEVPFNGVTWDISSLGLDIAQLGEVPGESAGENIVLAGHFSIKFYQTGPFRYISRLAIGEPIQVFTDQIVYTYQVREHALVGEQDERVIAPTDQPQLTLLTCETWDEKTGKFLRRRVVYADLINSEPLGQPIIQ